MLSHAAEQFDQFLDGVNKRTYQPKVLWPYIFPDHKEFLALIVHLRSVSPHPIWFDPLTRPPALSSLMAGIVAQRKRMCV